MQTRRTRWPRRATVGFADTISKHTAKHGRRIDRAVKPLTKDLRAVHAAAVDALAKALGVTKKGGDASQDDVQSVIADIRSAIDALALDGFADALYDAASTLAEAGWTDAKALLDMHTGFEVVPKRTLEALRSRLVDLQFLIEEREREALRATLDTAIADGLSTDEAAKLVRDTFAEGYHRIDPKTGDVVLIAPTKSWSETVARTELSNAQTQGALSLYTDAGVKTLRWQASDPCPICADYDDNVYPIDDLPDTPPVHPNCCCVLVPADEDLGSWRGTDDERAAAQRGNQPVSDEE